MKKKKDASGKPALDLIEEAVHLLRNAPSAVHLCYYTGSIPFVLALLYFWSDMSRGAFAYDRVASGSMELAALFLWMKCWQSVAASKLMAFASGSQPIRWAPKRLWRLLVAQAAIQPTALFVRPVALLITLPYPWVRAFYENMVVLGDGGESASLGEVTRKARRLAGLWPSKSMLVVVWLSLFAFIVWLNVAVLIVCAPFLLRTFTGIETAFTQSFYTVFNSTFLAISIGCSYLCVNPLTKAVYVLRCFYGESVQSGDDLRLGMRRVIAAAAVAIFLVCLPVPAHADSSPPPPAAKRVDSLELNDSITRVLKRDEFAWRMPRQPPPESSGNFLTNFLSDVQKVMGDWLKSFAKKLQHWLDNWFKDKKPRDSDSHISFAGLSGLLHIAFWVIIGLLAILLVWLIATNWRGFKRVKRLEALAVTAVPDLTSEDVIASQLPEEEWLRMAQEMIDKGEYRLAIRALYLAVLAHLGFRELISIARYKSNRDYQTELRRRARAQTDLQSAFGDSLMIFEGVWYGSHGATEEKLRQFSGNIERIRSV